MAGRGSLTEGVWGDNRKLRDWGWQAATGAEGMPIFLSGVAWKLWIWVQGEPHSTTRGPQSRAAKHRGFAGIQESRAISPASPFPDPRRLPALPSLLPEIQLSSSCFSRPLSSTC